MALPNGYKQLEYIQSSGTQYINTNVVADSNTRVVIEAQYPSAPTSNSTALFGERNGNVNEFWCYYRPTSSGFSCQFGDGGTNKVVAGTPTDRNVLDMNKNVLTINGNASVTATASTFTSSYQMYLFAVNNAGTAQYGASVIIYSCKIYNNGVLVRDFTPAMRNSDNTVGLYDLVDGIFYTNVGSGTFEYKVAKLYNKVLVNGTAYKIGGGLTLDQKAVGSSVYLNVGGVPREFLVVHKGLPSSAYDSSCDGIWLLMKDIYTEMMQDESYAGDPQKNYPECDVHFYLNDTFFYLFDTEVQSIIKSAQIPYWGNKGGWVSGEQVIFNTPANVFLLSCKETGQTKSDNPISQTSYMSWEGDCLDYFTDTDKNKRIAYYNGTADWWFLRSEKYVDDHMTFAYDSYGRITYQPRNAEIGVRPALILPYDVTFDPNTDMIGNAKLGNCMVDGTGYSVHSGKTMINGTIYAI